VFSEFCYTGAQEVNGTNYDSYLAAVKPEFNAANNMAIAHTAFAVARFVAAGLGFWIKPRVLMLGFYLGAIIFSALAMTYDGDTGVAMMVMVFFFEGPIFALVFAQSLRGMGKNTKFASVLITAAISGGSVFAPISNDIAYNGRGAMYAVVVGLAVFAGGTLFPIYLNICPPARKQCDPIKDAASPAGSRPGSDSSRASRALSFLHIGKKRHSRDPQPATEWRERKGSNLSPERHGLA
jgi:hypothetical protein